MKNILLYRYTLFNILCIAWLSATEWQSGWFSAMVNSDTTYVSQFICAVFLAVWGMTSLTMSRLNRDSNRFMGLMQVDDMRGTVRESELEWIERAAVWMVILGLLGTIRGLQLSLEGVNSGNLASLEGIKSLAVQMITGLRIELKTTLIGIGAGLWTEINYTLMKHIAVKLGHAEDTVLVKSLTGEQSK